MGPHAPNFQQTCPRHDFNVNKISEYKDNMKYELLSVAKIGSQVSKKKNDRKRGRDSLQVSNYGCGYISFFCN